MKIVNLKFIWRVGMAAAIFLYGCGQNTEIDPDFNPGRLAPVVAQLKVTAEEGVTRAEISEVADFAEVELGDTKRLVFTFRNTGGREMRLITLGELQAPFRWDELTDLELGLMSSTQCQSSLAIDDECSRAIVFEPTTVGTFSRTLEVTYHNGRTTLAAEIILTGQGFEVDTDLDDVIDDDDNCPGVDNVSQLDTDQDGTGDACDSTPYGGTSQVNVGSHYWVYYAGAETFADARAACIDLGGHLATIQDETERVRLNSLSFADRTYIGLTDIDSEGAFVWVTGESEGFRYWGAGEPDNNYPVSGGADAVSLRTVSGWQDEPDSAVLPYICEFGDNQIDDLTVGSQPDGDDTCGINPGCQDNDSDMQTPAQGDCNDFDATIYSGASDNNYDFVDNNCNGSVDEDFTCDADGDGYSYAGCPIGSGTDCNDVDPSIHPYATELDNGVDDDCSGIVDEGFDQDGDGFTINAGDCDDFDSYANPLRPEVDDGIDNDCDGDVDEGFDLDSDGYTPAGGDCNDSDTAIYPGASEICGNGIDENCSGAADENICGMDIDGDGYSPNAGDCDDNNPIMHPAGSDNNQNGLDDDCDGLTDDDYVAPFSDTDADGYTSDVDCNDSNPLINPGANDNIPDATDNDCDGLIDEDVDNDMDGYLANVDCDNNDASIHPGANDDTDDDLDNDCDGQTDEDYLPTDSDGDGWSTADGDCVDSNFSINPGANEADNGIDDNCDGQTDEGWDMDGDGYTQFGGDCDPNNGTVSPGVAEISGNFIDDNCDGQIDE